MNSRFYNFLLFFILFCSQFLIVKVKNAHALKNVINQKLRLGFGYVSVVVVVVVVRSAGQRHVRWQRSTTTD